MLCPNCGSELKSIAKFCTHCGQKVESAGFELAESGVLQIITIRANRLDISNHEQFQSMVWQATEAGHNLVAVDMNGVEFIDSLAVGTLMGLSDDLRNKGGKIILVGVGDNIMKVLDMAGFLTMFEIHPDMDTLMAQYHKPPADA